MAGKGIAITTEPLSDEEPCGPDLDEAEDAPFMAFMSNTELVLPDAYMIADPEGKRVPFYLHERFKEVNLGAMIEAGGRFLTRTHDLRLLSLLAKLQILNRSLAEFEATVVAMADLLDTWWKEIHPRGEGGVYALRTGALERLNEPLIVVALNSTTLFRSRRYGVVTGRTYLAAVRDKAGEGGEADTAPVDKILADESKDDRAPLTASHAILDRLQQALGRLQSRCAASIPAGPPNLGKLSEAVAGLIALLGRVDPSLAAPPPAEAPEPAADARADEAILRAAVQPAGTAPLFETGEAAAAALAEAARYFAAAEPSSPALLLVRQAQALVGKSFLEAMQVLLPDHVRKASLSIGAAPIFTLPLTLLAEAGAPAALAEEQDAEPAPPPAEPPPAAASRREALALLERVGAHYRASEPSSAIPLLTDRALGLAGRDFLSLIQTMLPDSARSG